MLLLLSEPYRISFGLIQMRMRTSHFHRERESRLINVKWQACSCFWFLLFFFFSPKLSLSPWDRQTDRSTFAQSIGEEARARALVYSKLLHQIRLVHIFHRHMRTRQKKIYPFSIHYQMTASQHSEMKQPRPLCDIYTREKEQKLLIG